MATRPIKLVDRDIIIAFIRRTLREEMNRESSQIAIITPENIQGYLDEAAVASKVKQPSFPRGTIESTNSPEFFSNLNKTIDSTTTYKRSLVEGIEKRKASRKARNQAPVTQKAQKIFNDLEKTLSSLSKGESGATYVKVVPGKSITIQGNFKAINNLKSSLKGTLTKATNEYLENTQLGHLNAVVAIGVENLLAGAGVLMGPAAQNLVLFKDELNKIQNAIAELEVNSKYILELNNAGVREEILLTFESKAHNEGIGAAAGGLTEYFWTIFTIALTKSINKISDKELAKVFEARFNPTNEELVAEFIESIFLEKRLRNRKYLPRFKNKPKEKAFLKIGKVVKGRRTRKNHRTPSKSPGLFRNLLDLKNIINANMHEILKTQVMGQGGDSEILNYKTGRFARSAELLNLTPMSAGLQAQITWQRYPYDTFAPGGKLHKPMRDPSYLIGKSIREIMKDLGLAQLNITTKAE